MEGLRILQTSRRSDRGSRVFPVMIEIEILARQFAESVEILVHAMITFGPNIDRLPADNNRSEALNKA